MEEILEECRDYMDFLKSDDYHEDRLGDYQHAIFEKAMQITLGEDIFDEVNKYII